MGAGITVAGTITEPDVYLYAGITGDFSPGHVNTEFMKDSRCGERIAAVVRPFMRCEPMPMERL
jgi:3-hydroxybutyryl-CoA dehydratase